MSRLSLCLSGGLILLLLLGLAACGGPATETAKPEATAPAVNDQALMKQAKAVFGPLPDKMPGAETDTPELIALGKMLYFEDGISVNKTQSCNACHPIDANQGGADNLTTSKGAVGTFGTRNSPTVLNAGFQFAQFWDGRAKDLAEQAKGPITNPIEMGMPTEADVVKRLSGMENYRQAFTAAFPNRKDPINYDNLALAVAAFERTLITQDRFDDYLAGNTGALTNEEKQGLQLMVSEGCIQCHMGPTMGGRMYQKMGVMQPYADAKDLGRYDVTKDEADKYFFKVPILRNVAITAPYFHDGRVKTLREAIDQMATLQLGKTLTPEKTARIEAFLGALTGKDRVAAGKQAKM